MPRNAYHNTYVVQRRKEEHKLIKNAENVNHKPVYVGKGNYY